MADTNIQTIEQALLLLSKVSSKLESSINASKQEKPVEKVTQTKEKKTDATDEKVAKLTNALEKREEKNDAKAKDEKKPAEVVENEKPVVITSFGRKATETLKEAFTFEEDKPKEEKPVEEKSWLSKLFGPGILALLGMLGGVAATLLKGGFGDLIEQYKKGGLSGILTKIGETVQSVLSPVINSLPVIGPMFSFWNAYKAFDKGNLIGGINQLAQGIIGLLPGLTPPMKAAIFGGMDVLAALLENQFGKELLPKGAGANFMAAILKSTSAVFKMFGKSGGILKKLPIIGSLFNFYEAYEFFTGSDNSYSGWAKAMLNIASGISGLFPGVGTAISIGIDVISALVFQTETNEKGEKKTTTRDWISDFAKKTKDIYRKAMIGLKNMLPGFLGNLIKVNPDGSVEISGEAFVSSLYDDITDSLSGLIGETKKEQTDNADRERVMQKGRIAKAKLLAIKKWEEMHDAKYQEGDDLTAFTKDAFKEIDKDEKARKVNDFIKTPDGKLIEPSKDDTLIGFKPGSPIDKFFNKGFELSTENNKLLKKLTEGTNDLLQRQLDMMVAGNKIMMEMKENMGGNITNVSRSSVVNNTTTGFSLRDLQAGLT